MTSTLHWFRDDLRLADNAALSAAAEGEVTALYVYDGKLGGAARWWLHLSLSSLARDLAEVGVPLRILAGDPRDLVPAAAREVGAQTVTWSRRYHRPLAELDREIAEFLPCDAVELPGFLLVEPADVATQQGTPYKVFTPFSKRLREHLDDDALPLADSATLTGPGADLAGTLAQLHELNLLPTWPEKFSASWCPGEATAHERLADFVGTTGYAEGRDLPAQPATSRLSPHLRFGEISPRRVWEAARRVGGEDGHTFGTELLWRDFAWHRLYHRPDLSVRNVRAEFDRFPWSWDGDEFARTTSSPRDPRHSASRDSDLAEDLTRWRTGTTGIPLVDAGMRELWSTGFMHNRLRMVVGSFLTKNLGVHWRHGEEWFSDTLVDADPASNAFNWQWVAGCGDDASPYFRIFNPLNQARKFDPDGTYIRRWVPEVDSSAYPQPMVDLRESRQAALDAYALTRGAR